ncbi:septation protein A [[Haemophilus] ducreyi]|uniref:septation protein A n=1 Tax=Haemophilus ducreyi TaxID=730 RepID=UPI000655C2D6|nr:septation protein A [[Haemophilus] ducreyi]AKO45790.1 septation protein A [[Haemophilus] ducreyi]AKO47176.1 septation protein A [[Haemophilus] ducreyi]AKO48540.1 septation protein A [[Haemophilus] ducreyi]AKO49910.1 septation protein A [[Haemophilus] ducreyi]ANF62381.1 septation protein A [[Haemophilus] ducreyi]
MKQLLEFIPLILFFAVYKLVGVQAAAITLVLATILQLILVRILFKKLETSQWIVGLSVIIFGILTAYFDDLAFLKWKVTIINGLFAAVLLISQYVFHKPVVKMLLAKELNLPTQVWNRLNLGWAIFFIICMLINIIISQLFSDDTWATFKTFGFTGLSLVAVIITGIYLYPYIKKLENNNEQK